MRHRFPRYQHGSGRRATVVALAVTVAMLAAACGTGDQASPGSGEAKAETATRTVTHALGTTEIPAEPERIVALWGPTLSALLTLGEEPVAAVEPDLIIGIENYAGERYDVVADYDRRVDEVREAVGEPSDIEVSIVRFQGDEVRLEGRDSSAGVVVDDLGLARPPSQDFADEGYRAVSLERLADADGDVLFYWANDEEGKELVDRARENPLWTSLEVVRNDAAHTVDGDVWGGASYLAGHQVLDKIEAVLGGGET